MRDIKKIIIHCSATKSHQNIGAKEIKKWHTDPKPYGNGWSDIGYHEVIQRDGTVEQGRHSSRIGAHCAGHNRDSIGICMVGGISDDGMPQNNFTDKQWKSLRRLVIMYKAQNKRATVHGHNEFSSKACPSFDVQEWLKDELI